MKRWTTIEVVEDLLGGVDLEIARRQRGEMGVQFLLVQVGGHEFADLLHQQFALFLLGADEFGAAGEQRQGAVVQFPAAGRP